MADASGPGGIWVMKNDGSEKRWIGKGAEPNWHFSNQKIVGIIGDFLGYQRLRFYHVDPDSLIGIGEFKSKSIISPEYSPDGSRIAVITGGGGPGGIWILDAYGNNAKRILAPFVPDNCCKKENGLFVDSPSWFPDGNHLIYEHIKVTDFKYSDFGSLWEGFFSFYKVNVDSALAISTLP